ncbi:MAG: bifunctional phosphoribosyl-AMP cyclohydrolase/phosphoribosyl-ATP diphosphatase HisIE [Clostridiales bacterium]|nr:bifunctional phosphoribosyl-AMP cyclohydrolase/phosphoribosyl-ATP diphosphatase HisIE [Clostridiales bacterium]
MNLSEIRFDEHGLVPAIAQDIRTGEVLMLAYMNEESLRLTLETGYATYFSRSRKQLWKKGETSGHVQQVMDMRYDCDGDTILMKVIQTGNACHTGHYSCFFNSILEADPDEVPANAGILQSVYDVISDRRVHPQEGSYTNYLFDKGVEKMCKKVGEEASETIIAAMKGNKEEVTYEVADLMYHLLVLMNQQGVTPDDVYEELARRR